MKIDKFDDDIDLVDVVRLAVIEGDLSSPGSGNVLDRVDPARHTHIGRRRNSDGGRELIANHLRKTVYSSYIKDLYEEVTHYLKEILRLAALNGFDAGRLVGEHSFKIDARKALEFGSWERFCDEVTSSVFQVLEAERSTIQLLRKMNSKLGLTVANATIEDALPYLEARHLLVHNDGRVTPQYRDSYPQVTIRGQKIQLDLNFIANAREAIFSLVESFDQSLVANNLLLEEQLHTR